MVCRCRDDARADLMRARHRLGKMLRRRDLRYLKGRPWTEQLRAWLWSLKLEHAAERMVLEDYLLAVEQVSTRLATLDAQLKELADEEPYRERVGWLRCLRGIDTITALSVLAELHSFERFAKPRQLMAYLGLVPSESSSGASVHRGAITKIGNRHLRRLLTEAAHHCRHRPGGASILARGYLRHPGRKREGLRVDVLLKRAYTFADKRFEPLYVLRVSDNCRRHGPNIFPFVPSKCVHLFPNLAETANGFGVSRLTGL